MNDLEILRDAWDQPDPPSPAAYHAARAGLLQLAAAGPDAWAPARGRRFRLPGRVQLVATAAMVAAIAAGATFAAGSGGTAPAATGGLPAAPVRLSAQQILLAAATAAQKQHPGTYWHFKITIEPPAGAPKVSGPAATHIVNTYESWVGRDGEYWNTQPSCAAPPGTVVFEGPGLAGFSLGAPQGKLTNPAPMNPAPQGSVPPGTGDLTYQQTQHLPTGPAALKAWFARYNPDSSFIVSALIALQYEVPAPPQVRAAAFRALATLPDVKNLGPVPGGQALLISFPQEPWAWIKLVVDPATSLLRSESGAKGTTLIETAEWTNRLPRVVPLPAKNACSGGH
jgi:hypothetical protein